MQYTKYDVDRMYRHLLDVAPDLWLTQPSYDTQPRERRPVDELPRDVTDYLSRAEALERLPQTQQVAYRAVVLGQVRMRCNGVWKYVRARPMTYQQCGEYLNLSKDAVGMRVMRAREALAAMLSDEEGEAAA
jgi:DNA-directed RNA polymerase specialized sigma24 family protein